MSLCQSFNTDSIPFPAVYDTTSVLFTVIVNVKLEPTLFKEATLIPDWCEALNVELATLEANGTWEVVPFPKNKKPVGCKWLYKMKYKSDGQLDRYKARLVTKEFTQTWNILKHSPRWQR